MLNDAYAASLATIPGGHAKDDGVATGERVLALVILNQTSRPRSSPRSGRSGRR